MQEVFNKKHCQSKDEFVSVSVSVFSQLPHLSLDTFLTIDVNSSRKGVIMTMRRKEFKKGNSCFKKMKVRWMQCSISRLSFKARLLAMISSRIKFDSNPNDESPNVCTNTQYDNMKLSNLQFLNFFKYASGINPFYQLF